MRKITGLYKSKTKDGEVFMSGKTMDGVKYFVFKNKKKQDNHPDYNLFVDDGEDETETKKSGYQKNSGYSKAKPKQEEMNYDDIPF